MNLVPTAEQQQFRDMVARFLAEHSPTDAVRRHMASETGFDADIWRRLGTELGLTGLAIPEAYGGAGFGAEEVAIAMHEMGRALYAGPYFGSAVLATHALIECADESAKARLLPRLAGAERIAALVGSYRPPGIAYADGGLSGRARLVVDGMAADTLLVVADDAGAAALFEVDPADPAPGREHLRRCCCGAHRHCRCGP